MWTSTGPRAIETLHAGDRVLARDPLTGRQEFRRVARLITTRPRRLYRVVYARPPAAGDKTRLARGALDGEADAGAGAGDGQEAAGGELVCTGEHPFFVVERAAFVPASELQAGARLLLADGTQAAVQASSLWREAQANEPAFTTYNLEVEDSHTFFVGEEGVWVHNQGGWCEDLFSVFKAVQGNLKGLWPSYDWLLQHPPPRFLQTQGKRWALRLFNEVRAATSWARPPPPRDAG